MYRGPFPGVGTVPGSVRPSAPVWTVPETVRPSAPVWTVPRSVRPSQAPRTNPDSFLAPWTKPFDEAISHFGPNDRPGNESLRTIPGVVETIVASRTAFAALFEMPPCLVGGCFEVVPAFVGFLFVSYTPVDT